MRNFLVSLSVGIPFAFAAVSCAPSADVQTHRALAEDPHWALVRADAQRTIRHREQQDFWAANARYTPYSYDGRVWTLRVSGAYPMHVGSDFIDMVMRDDGTVLNYTPSQQHDSMVLGQR